MAGHSSIVNKRERANTVRPQTEFVEISLNPMHDPTTKSESKEDEGTHESWEELAQKYENLETRVAEQLENTEENERDAPPRIKVLTKPTKEEWERHQTPHTPYVVWCPHCAVARNVRRNHPARGRKVRLAFDTEKGDGLTKVSMDYMYMYDRIGKHRDIQHNPPYFVVIEHRHGRCWAHQVPNKGVNDGAYWVPKKIIQDLGNSGFGKHGYY